MIGIFGNGGTDTTPTETTPSHTESLQGDQSNNNDTSDTINETEPLEVVLNDYIADAVSVYNSKATEKLVFIEDFKPSDKENGHYRTEFRLTAYKDAVGKSYVLGDKVVDIIASKTIYDEIDCRVYTNDTSLSQVVALIEGFSPILDEELTSDELKKTLDEVSTKKTANGYYFGELGITLFGSDDKGYELMLKND